MSQDNQVCIKCGNLCGYDDQKGYWPEHNKALCGRCKRNMIMRFATFFNVQPSSDDMNLLITFEEADRILSNIKRDFCMRASYVTTDKQMYEREQMVSTPIEKDVAEF